MRVFARRGYHGARVGDIAEEFFVRQTLASSTVHQTADYQKALGDLQEMVADGVELIPLDAFTPLTRAGVRLAKGAGGRPA